MSVALMVEASVELCEKPKVEAKDVSTADLVAEAGEVV